MIRKILHYPDPRLRNKAQPVAVMTPALQKLVDDMAETMYAAPGVGLAATQVDVHERLIVIDVSDAKDRLQVFINPEIVGSSAELQAHEEGCLSVPGIFEEVERPERVRVKALGLDGKPFTCDAEGLLAVCLQHEIDHLNGRVFVQYLSRLKQSRIRSKIHKRDQAAA